MDKVLVEPWFWLIMSTTCIEIICHVKLRKSAVILAVMEIIKIVLHVSEEIRSDEGKDKICAIIVGTCLILLLGPVIRIMHLACKNSDESVSMFKSVLLECIIIVITIAAYRINRTYVVKK